MNVLNTHPCPSFYRQLMVMKRGFMGNTQNQNSNHRSGNHQFHFDQKKAPSIDQHEVNVELIF